MSSTYTITYYIGKIERTWFQVTEFYVCERRIRFITREGKVVILCGHWTMEED